MKKFYFTVLSLAVACGSVFSQSKTVSENLAPTLKNRIAPRIDVTPWETAFDRANDTVLWSDDFSTPGNWVITNEIGNTDDWVIGPDGPAGTQFGIDPIASTSGGNFALFDSDIYCSGNQVANLTTAIPIDLSAEPGAVLQFEQFYRRFLDSTFVFISNDSVNWVKYTVNETMGNNEFVATNPELVQVDISATAGGEAAVWIRFQFSSPSSYPGASGCGYAWMVDDIAIVPLPEDDIKMVSAYITHNGTGEEYGRIPQNQTDQDMIIGCEVLNFGSADQDNISLSAEFTGVTAFSASASLSMLASGTSEFLNEISAPGPLADGVYTGTFTITSDNDTVGGDLFENNTLVRKFEVSDSIYSTDGIGVYDNPSVTSMGTSSWIDTVDMDGFIAFNYFDVTNLLSVRGIQVLLANGTQVGSSLIVAIYDSSNVLSPAGSFQIGTIVTESDIYDITQADIDTGWVTIYFSQPEDLQNAGYFASCQMFSYEGDNHIRILDDETVSQPNYLSMIYLPSDETIYTNGTAVGIRMIVDFEPVGIAERKKLEGISIYPNPTEGLIRINMEVQDTYTIEVMNVLGELVLSTTASSNTSIDLNRFGSGFYMVRVSSDEASVTQKVIVQ